MPIEASVEDIRVVDLDLARTQISRVHPAMRVVHLRLNRAPEPAWVRFFHEDRESRIGVRRCGLWIEDCWIALDCRPEDIESHHLPDILCSLTAANARHRQWVAEQRAARAADAALAEADRRALEALRTRLPALLADASRAAATEARTAAEIVESPAQRAGVVAAAECAAHAAAHDARAGVSLDTAAAADTARATLEGLGARLAGYRLDLRAAQARAAAAGDGAPSEPPSDAD